MLLKRIGQLIPLQTSAWRFANAHVTEAKLFNRLGFESGLRLAISDIAQELFREADK